MVLAPVSLTARVVRGFALAAVLLALAGCRVLGDRPSNFRDWSPDQAVTPYAEVDGDLVRVYHIRNCTYLSEDNYVVNYYDKTYDLSQIRTVDFIVIPFKNIPAVAHTMVSFGFEGDDYLAVSVEIRKEKGENYSMIGGFIDKFELMYVVGDERDLVKLRTNFRNDDVYVYRAKAGPEQVRALFVDMMKRTNKLANEPEFYNAITNNCTTNIYQHINDVAPGAVPYGYQILFPGYSDRLAFSLGLLDTKASSFEEARRQANVSEIARRYGDSPDFSTLIRR